MDRGRIAEIATNAAGSVAGTAADPRRGLGRLRAVLASRTGAVVVAAMAVGYLAARIRRG